MSQLRPYNFHQTGSCPPRVPSLSSAFSLMTYKWDPLTLLATGYGKYHPVASNASVAGRAKNRRIEIILVYLRNR